MAAPEKKLAATEEAQKEKQKKVLAGVLVALLGVVFYVQDPFGFFPKPEQWCGESGRGRD
jgi:hypothetical protein